MAPPISLGKITFISTGKDQDFGSDIINDGEYTVKAPVGPCKIEITIQSDENKNAIPPGPMGKMIEAKMKQLKEQGVNVPDIKELQKAKKNVKDIPAKYKSVRTSNLEFDVQSGTQTKDWDLQ